MRVVVTGHNGFIGSNLVSRLEQLDHEVTGVDIKSNGPVQFIDKIIRFKPDVIYHLAAQSRVQTSFNDPYTSFDDNVIGTAKVLEFARKHKCKVIYAGSSAKHADPYGSPYSATKMMAGDLCKAYRECYDVDVVETRFWNVYGPGEALDPINGNVIGIWRYNIKNRLPCKIVGDGNQRRDFIHVDDIVDGMITAAECVSRPSDAWELGTANFYSINDIAGYFRTKYPEAEFEYVEDRKGNFKNPIMRSPEFGHLTGWAANKRVENYIRSL